MKNPFIAAIVSAVIAALVSVCFLAGFAPETATPNDKLGGTFNPVLTSFEGGIKVGLQGSNMSQMLEGTCNLIGGAIAATSTAIGYCAVTGVKAGDAVFTNLSTSTPAGTIVGASASTTPGFIEVRILNLSGAASSVSTFGTSTQYQVIR